MASCLSLCISLIQIGLLEEEKNVSGLQKTLKTTRAVAKK